MEKDRLRGTFVATLVAISLALTASSAAAKESMPMTERCEASWYGPGMKLHKMPDGSRKPLTATGKVFNMDDPELVAHKEYPIGTRLKVTNLSNGLSLILTVKDRGPYTPGRCVDLSRAAAKNIGMYCGPSCGTAPVKVEVISLGSKK
ncbi:MAG: septal ring lytic transglycosylase RlpA family protein [Candidatus Paceibacteria bacterium]